MVRCVVPLCGTVPLYSVVLLLLLLLGLLVDVVYFSTYQPTKHYALLPVRQTNLHDQILTNMLLEQTIRFNHFIPRCNNRTKKVMMPLPSIGVVDEHLKLSTNIKLFFLETSGSSVLNVRQSCAVESGARVSRRRVLVLLTSRNIDVCQEQLKRLLVLDPGVLFIHLNETEIINNSVISPLWVDGKFRPSCCEMLHKSDLLRMEVIYRYGGWYTDLDTITTNTTAKLVGNIVVYNGNGHISNGNFIMAHGGNKFLVSVMEGAVKKFTGKHWNELGPVLWAATVLQRIGKKKGLVGVHSDLDIRVVNPDQFLPVQAQHRQLLFQNHTDQHWQDLFKNAISVHFFNQITKSNSVQWRTGASTAYDYLGKLYCPSTYSVQNNLDLYMYA